MADNDEAPNKWWGTAMLSSFPPWEQLPDDLWHKIFTHQPHRTLGSVSLVCKRFLALSNRTRTFISINSSTKPIPLPSLFSRFHNINSITLGLDLHLGASLTLLANSGLPLRSLHLFYQTHFPKDAMRLLGDRMSKTLKSLICFWFKNINDDDLAVMAASFPYLQHLDVQESDDNPNYLTDRGIFEISTKLNSLVSVTIGYQKHLTHRSLQYLTSNCPSLCKLEFCFGVYNDYIDMDQLDRFDSFRSLSYLHLEHPIISRRVLVELSKFNLKLENLILDSSVLTNDVTGEVLCGFFKSCRFLRHLHLRNISFPADTNAITFAASLPNIRVIRLRENPNTMPPATLLYLLKDCPLLEEIHIACSFLGINLDWFNNTSTLFLVRTLDLSYCNDLCDETLKLLVSVCPKLEALCLMKSSKITRKGLEAVAASCSSIKYIYGGLCEDFSDFKLNRRGHVLEQ